MKNTKNNKNITCRIVSTGTIMHVNTIDEILSPGHYKIDACGVTVHDGFPDGVDGECLSAYLEVSDTNHSNDNLKSAAVGQTLSCTNASGVTAAYYRSAITKNGMVEWNSWVDLGAATTTDIQDGSITAEKLSKDVRTKIDNPLQPLFIAAGAEYNNTGVDKTKTAPWGETVTHKAGHYYLNGLGDITEDEMLTIYNYKNTVYNLFVDRFAQGVFFRTIVGYPGGTILQRSNAVKLSNMVFYGNNKLEVLKWGSCGIDETGGNSLSVASTLHATFGECSKLRIVYPMNVNQVVDFYNTFAGCSSLVEIRLEGVKSNLSLADSPLISKKSILYILDNSLATSAITLTLHPDAYSRLSDDKDILDELTSKDMIAIVSA